MQLNNTKTGEFFIFQRMVQVEVDEVKEWQALYFLFQNKQDNYPKPILEPVADFELNLYNQYKDTKGVNFEVANTDVNWVFPLSAEQFATTIRMTIPSSIVNDDPTSPISVFIIGMASVYEGVSIKQKFARTVYLTTINPDYIPLLEPYVLSQEILVEELKDGKVNKLESLNKFIV